MNEGRIEEYEALPKAGSHRLIDFERAEVWGLDSDPPQEFVAVSGRKPYANMWVDLAPLMYVGRPGYWGIEVVGRLPLGIGLPSEGQPSDEAQYNVTIPLYGITETGGQLYNTTEVIGMPISVGRLLAKHQEAESGRRRRVDPLCSRPYSQRSCSSHSASRRTAPGRRLTDAALGHL